MESRDKYVEDLKNKLDEWNEQITRTEEKMKAASESAQETYKTQIAEMTEHMDAAQKQMEQLMKSSTDEWDKHRATFETAWHDIAGGFGRAWSRFQ